jgi:2-keto-4-pentenoate hydratase
MDPVPLASLADSPWRAEADRAPISQITGGWPDLSMADAYAIQTRNVEDDADEGCQGKELPRGALSTQ